MLYAVSSTGNLTTGTHRPVGCDSDEKWYLHIWRRFSVDVCLAVRAAGAGCNADAHDDGHDADYPALVEFESWVDSTVERLEREYGLDNWEA